MLASLRSTVLLWSLATCAVAMLAPPSIAVAAAKKKKKKGLRKDADEDLPAKKAIKKGNELSPKEEVELDKEIGTTKDLKVKVEEGNRPSLTPAQMSRKELEGLVESKLDEEVQ